MPYISPGLLQISKNLNYQNSGTFYKAAFLKTINPLFQRLQMSQFTSKKKIYKMFVKIFKKIFLLKPHFCRLKTATNFFLLQINVMYY